jgi:SAM-dependent methyltransferase
MLPIASYNLKSILEGGLSLLPGFGQILDNRTRGTDSARYCYSVWMRHLRYIHNHCRKPLKGWVVELGPGDSLGTGMAALLSGSSRYFAVDVSRHANSQRNMKVLEQLVSLFADRSPIPDNKEFPELKPHIDDFRFPENILDNACMEKNLDPRRLQAIADCLLETGKDASPLQYINPQAASTTIVPGSVDLVFSQAVLEHVKDLSSLYRICRTWLKPHGLMSHQIDFRSHGTSREWNGHWAYPQKLWRLIRGNRRYLLNREPCSTHLRLLSENGFQMVIEERARLSSRLRQGQLAAPFRTLSEMDLTTSGVYLLSQTTNRELRLN